MKPTESEMRHIKMLSEEKEVRAILAQEFSASRMSATKWRETLLTLTGLAKHYQVKFVDVSEPLRGSIYPVTEKYFDGSWGPVLVLSVEWLEIDPIEQVSRGLLQKPAEIDHTAEVERRLDSLNVSHQREGRNIRIISHIRNIEQAR